MFAPLHDEVTLICSVEDRFAIDWHVVLSNGDEAVASNRRARMLLMQRGFTLEGVTTTRSTLSIRETETQTNNGTNITCLAQEAGAETPSIAGNAVLVIYGQLATATHANKMV